MKKQYTEIKDTFIGFYQWYISLGGIIENRDLDKVVEKFI